MSRTSNPWQRGLSSVRLEGATPVLLPGVVFLVMALLFLLQCRESEPEGPPSESSPAAEEHAASPPEEPAAPPEDVAAAAAPSVSDDTAQEDGASPAADIPTEIRELLVQMPKHGRCSLLMGCPPADALLRQGDAAVEPLIAFYRATSGDAYWRQKVLELIGRLGGGDEAADFLVERLRAPDEPLDVDAALALGHMKAQSAEKTLRERHAAVDPKENPGLRLALAYALTRLGSEAHRDEIHAALAPERTADLNPGQLRTLLTIVRWLDERDREDVRAFVRRALTSENVFVRRAAVRLVRDWLLRDDAPYLFPLLEDQSPGVRDEALEALRQITGYRYKTTREQWERWCRKDEGCELPAKP